MLRNGYKKTKFRLSFYSVRNGLPKDILVNENIIFDVIDRYEGWVDLDLHSYNIHLPSGEFAATLTLLEDELADEAPNWFVFPGTMISRYVAIDRDKAMGSWRRSQGMFSIYLDVTAYINHK